MVEAGRDLLRRSSPASPMLQAVLKQIWVVRIPYTNCVAATVRG